MSTDTLERPSQVTGHKAIEARAGSLEAVYDASITWRHIAPDGVSIEDVQRPTYWRNVVREAGQQRVPKRHSWNKIEVLAADGSWECMLRVTSIEKEFVYTRLIYAAGDIGAKFVETPSAPSKKGASQLPKGYKVEHLPSGWRALDPNGEEVDGASGKTQKADAVRAAIAHSRAAAD